MPCHVQDGLDEDFFTKHAEQVLSKIDGLDGIDVDIVAIRNPAQCGDLVKDLPVTEKEEFVQNCEDALTSVSYRTEGHEIIVIKADKPFISNNPAALRGLLAHELMHVVHRHNGVEEAIQNAAKDYTQEAIQRLRELGMTDTEIGGFIGTVFATAIFCLKDIYANTDLIQQTFTADLEEYYYNILGVDGYCRVPDFYGKEATIDDLENALAFELGLVPAWLPFEQLDRDTSDRVQQRIHECYERDLPDVSAHMKELGALYQDTYDNPELFRQRFFEQVIKISCDVIAQKLSEPRFEHDGSVTPASLE